jgi:hypothetical protein
VTVPPRSPIPGHATHNCHWSVPTLFLPAPYWLFAWDSPWSCWNSREIVVLSSTEGCAFCPLWSARRDVHSLLGPVRPEGAVPLPPEPTGRVRIGDGHGRGLPRA